MEKRIPCVATIWTFDPNSGWLVIRLKGTGEQPARIRLGEPVAPLHPYSAKASVHQPRDLPFGSAASYTIGSGRAEQDALRLRLLPDEAASAGLHRRADHALVFLLMFDLAEMFPGTFAQRKFHIPSSHTC
jgi:hypothetical protein